MSDETVQPVDQSRIKYGFWSVALGIVAVVLLFLACIAKWSAASDVASAMGSATGVIGTIVGAFFGVQVGSAGKEKAEDARDAAQQKVNLLAAKLPQADAEKILGTLR